MASAGFDWARARRKKDTKKRKKRRFRLIHTTIL